MESLVTKKKTVELETSYYVYRFVNEDNQVIYVGRTENLHQRLKKHFSGKGHLPQKCYDSVARVDYLTFKNKNDMKIKEIYYISVYQPAFNKVDVGKIDLRFNQVEDAWTRLTSENERLLSEINQLKTQNKQLKSKKTSLEKKYQTLSRKVSHKHKSFLEAVEVLKQEDDIVFCFLEQDKCKMVLYKNDESQIRGLYYDYQSMDSTAGMRYFVPLELADKAEVNITINDIDSQYKIAMYEQSLRSCQQWSPLDIPFQVDIEHMHPIEIQKYDIKQNI